MQGWNEKVSKSIQWIQKNRLVQWFYDKDISTQYRILFVILASVIIIWNIVNIYFNSFKIDDVSARYLLSALVQSLAAIIAIVVTLTLVAVQLTASVYSPRVIDIFKEDKVMWWLLAWYGLSIFFGLFVLEMIGGNYPSSNSWCITVPLEICVFLAYLMGIIAFAGLFWHIGNVIDLLKPENIIKRLSIEITEDKILNPKKDPIQPIMDIIHVSIMKYDIVTVGCGLDAVMKNAVYIIDISKYSDDKYISMHFCSRLGTAGRCALRAGEDESAMGIIGCLNDIGTLAIEMRSDKSAKAAVQYIEMIGTVAAEKKLRFVVCDAMESLKDVGILAAKNQLGDLALQAIDFLGNVGMYAADNKIGIAAQDAAKYLGRVGKCAAENELKNAAKQAADSLGVVGNYAADNKLKYAASEAALSLGVVGISAAEEGFKDATDQAARSLGDVGKAAAEKGLERAVEQAWKSLGQVGKTAAENGLRGAAASAAMNLVFFGRFEIEKGNEYTAERVIWFLEKIGKIAAEKRLEPVTWQAAESLGLLGMDAAEKGEKFKNVTNEVIERLKSVERSMEGRGLDRATKQVAQSFVWIGTFVVKNGLGDVAQEAAKSLTVIPNKELVEQVFRESESGLRAYYDSFRKFRDIYRQQFEEKPDPNTTTNP